MPKTMPKLALIDAVTLHVPRLGLHLPPELADFRILHVTDLHLRKPTKRIAKLVAELKSPAYPGCDLLLVTGDIMHHAGHESAAIACLSQIIEAAKPRLGAFGCFGNHDTDAFRTQARDLPITWLSDTAVRLGDVPVNIVGLHCSRNRIHGDLFAALLNEANDPKTDGHRLRILLSHLPTWLIPASEAGIDLMFSGHTHGGQCRLPGRRAFYNSCPDWPLHLSAGVVQQSRTLAVISRGLGESNVPGLRLFCKPHAPLITLQPPQAMHSDHPPKVPTLITPW